MSEDRPSTSQPKSWVTLATSIIGAAAVVMAAVVASGAKSDHETSSSEIRKLQTALGDREAEIQKLRAECTRRSDLVAANGQSAASKSVTSAEGGKLTVDLQECALRGDSLTCSFMVKSSTDIKDEYLRSSRLVEANGNEIAATAQQFGMMRIQGGGLSNQVSAELVRNVPIRATVTFAGVDTELSRKGIELIELHFDEFNARFSGVQAK